jgi:hypothetical protein
MTLIFPKNNLPEAAQAWAREIQKQVINVVTSSTADEVNNAARDSQFASSISTITTTLNGLVSLGRSGSSYTINADNLNAGAITASSIELDSSDYELRIATIDDEAYLRVSPDSSNGVGFNMIGFGASAGSNLSGWVSNVFPKVNNGQSLGVTGKRWTELWLTTGVITTSDSRLKTEIQPSELGLNFINSLNPVSYKWITSSTEIVRDENGNILSDENGETLTIDKPGIRPHYGLIAQELKSAITESGVSDFAGFVQEDPSDPDSLMSIRYEEFISPMIKAIQELSARVEELEGK